MGFLELGTQCRLKGYDKEPALNGRNCVVAEISLGVAGETVAGRFSCGKLIEDLDPSKHLELICADGELKVGMKVALAGLQTASLNGKEGTVGDPAHSKGRAMINLTDGTSKAIKYENIVLTKNQIPVPAAKSSAASGSLKPGGKNLEVGAKVAILNFVDPGLNGSKAVVLGIDSNEKDRFLVRVEKDGMVMSLKHQNLAPSGGRISDAELEGLRQPLKERFFTELRKLLWNQPEEAIPIATLASESVARHEGNNPFSPWSRMWAAWTALRATYSKPPEMYDCVLESGGQFAHGEGANGWGVVCLTDVSRRMLVDDGVPEPPTKKHKVNAETSRGKLDDMARALYSAMCMAGPKGTLVHMCQVGSDIHVRNLRNDKFFGTSKKKRKLEDMIREYPRVFELEMTGSGLMVRLTEEADVALPQRSFGESAAMGSGDVLPSSEAALLPEKLLGPRSRADKLQSLRIELIYALHRHQKRAEIGILGQEGNVQQARRNLEGTRSTKFVDLVRIFPDNFTLFLDVGSNNWIVDLESYDVKDMTPVTDWIKGKPSRAHVEAKQQAEQLAQQAKLKLAEADAAAEGGMLPPESTGDAEEDEDIDPNRLAQYFCHMCCSPVTAKSRFCSQCGAERPEDGWLNAGGEGAGEDEDDEEEEQQEVQPFPPLPPTTPAPKTIAWPKARGGKYNYYNNRGYNPHQPGTGLPRSQNKAMKLECKESSLPKPLQPGLVGKGAPIYRKPSQPAQTTPKEGEIEYGSAPLPEPPDPWKEWRAAKRGDDGPPTNKELDPWAEFGIYDKSKPK